MPYSYTTDPVVAGTIRKAPINTALNTANARLQLLVAEIEAARNAYVDLDTRLEALGISAGQVNTAADGNQGSGTALAVLDGSGIINGYWLAITTSAGGIEYRQVSSGGGTESLTLTVAHSGVDDGGPVSMMSAGIYEMATALYYGGTYIPTPHANLTALGRSVHFAETYGFSAANSNADNTTALVAALTAAGRGGIVVLPAGAYDINATAFQVKDAILQGGGQPIINEMGIVSISGAGTITVETDVAHDLTTGDMVWIVETTAFNNSVPKAVTVTDSTHFTFSDTGSGTPESSGRVFGGLRGGTVLRGGNISFANLSGCQIRDLGIDVSMVAGGANAISSGTSGAGGGRNLVQNVTTFGYGNFHSTVFTNGDYNTIINVRGYFHEHGCVFRCSWSRGSDLYYYNCSGSSLFIKSLDSDGVPAASYNQVKNLQSEGSELGRQGGIWFTAGADSDTSWNVVSNYVSYQATFGVVTSCNPDGGTNDHNMVNGGAMYKTQYRCLDLNGYTQRFTLANMHMSNWAGHILLNSSAYNDHQILGCTAYTINGRMLYAGAFGKIEFNSLPYAVNVITAGSKSIATGTWTRVKWDNIASSWNEPTPAPTSGISAINISGAAPIVTCVDHGLGNGDEAIIWGVQGASQANNRRYTVTKIDDDNVSLQRCARLRITSISGTGTVTVTTDVDHGLVTGQNVTITATSNFDVGSGTPVTVTGTDTFTISTTGHADAESFGYVITKTIDIDCSAWGTYTTGGSIRKWEGQGFWKPDDLDQDISGNLISPLSGDRTISVQVEFASNATGVRSVRITRSNDNVVYATRTVPAISGAVTQVQVEFSKKVPQDAWFFVEVYQDSGGNLNLDGTKTYARIE